MNCENVQMKESLKRHTCGLKEKMMKNLKIFAIVIAFLFLNGVSAKSLAEHIPKVDTATFCIKKVGGDSLELKIKRNIEIALPFEDLEIISTNDEKWHSQNLLRDYYDVRYPDDLAKKCKTLFPLTLLKHNGELQEYFKNRKKAQLSDYVENKCNVNEKEMFGRTFEGEYHIEIRRSSGMNQTESYKFAFRKSFVVKIEGRCLEEILYRKPNEEEK